MFSLKFVCYSYSTKIGFAFAFYLQIKKIQDGWKRIYFFWEKLFCVVHIFVTHEATNFRAPVI